MASMEASDQLCPAAVSWCEEQLLKCQSRQDTQDPVSRVRVISESPLDLSSAAPELLSAELSAADRPRSSLDTLSPPLHYKNNINSISNDNNIISTLEISNCEHVLSTTDLPTPQTAICSPRPSEGVRLFPGLIITPGGGVSPHDASPQHSAENSCPDQSPSPPMTVPSFSPFGGGGEGMWWGGGLGPLPPGDLLRSLPDMHLPFPGLPAFRE